MCSFKWLFGAQMNQGTLPNLILIVRSHQCIVNLYTAHQNKYQYLNLLCVCNRQLIISIRPASHYCDINCKIKTVLGPFQQRTSLLHIRAQPFQICVSWDCVIDHRKKQKIACLPALVFLLPLFFPSVLLIPLQYPLKLSQTNQAIVSGIPSGLPSTVILIIWDKEGPILGTNQPLNQHPSAL